MAEFIAYLNRDPASSLITPGTGATDGLEARVAKVEGDVVSAVRAIDGDRVSNSARHEELHTYLSRNSDRIAAVEGVLARICPEADSQTDGKGRTLVQIDREISDLCEIAQVTARRVTNLERLSAAQVPVPAKVHVRSDAASTVEAMTEAAASDEGWREMLVAGGTASRIVYTPCADWYCNDRLEWAQSCFPGIPVAAGPNGPNETQRTIIRTCPPPPNLAEWYKPGVKATTESGDDAAHRFAKELEAAREAVPPTYRVGDDLAAWVRNLASAHDTALKYQRQVERECASANEACRVAESRCANAVRRATEAESKLAELRAQLEAALT